MYSIIKSRYEIKFIKSSQSEVSSSVSTFSVERGTLRHAGVDVFPQALLNKCY